MLRGARLARMSEATRSDLLLPLIFSKSRAKHQPIASLAFLRTPIDDQLLNPTVRMAVSDKGSSCRHVARHLLRPPLRSAAKPRSR
jgi:hypothetical protein